MKRVTRSILALALALALCASLAVGAFAEQSDPESGEAVESASVWEDASVEESLEGAQVDEADVTDDAADEADVEEPGAETAEGAQVGESQAADWNAGEVTPQDELPDVEKDKDLISEKEAFVCLGQSASFALKNQPQSPARFVSLNPKAVTVQETGTEMAVTAVGVGKAVVEMRRAADDALLDTVTVYGFQSTSTSQKSGTRYAPGALTTTSQAAPTRTYPLTCQKGQSGKSYKSFLSGHGCTICSVAAVSQAFGNSKITVDWLMTGGLEEIALRSGTVLKDETLGYYGMQQVLDYAGISSKVYNWKDKSASRMEAAKEEMVKSLSAGRPVIMFMDKVPNGIMEKQVGTLFSDMHCVTIVGINESGKLLIINSIYPQGISTFKYKSKVQTLNITPGEMVDYFVRHSKMKRENKKDFYFTKYGGLHTFLEVTCDAAKVPKRTSIKKMSAKLEKVSLVFTGSSLVPKVVVGNLKEDQDFRVSYSGNKNVGTATASVVGLNAYEGVSKLKFTIKQAKGSITASNIKVKSKAEAQQVKLGASAKFGAKLTYQSSDSQLKVNSSGVVTVPANYAGEATITLTSAKSDNYTSATKKVTFTVEADLLVKDQKVNQSSKQRKVSLNASSTSGAQISYKSLDNKISVDSSGVVTIPKNYVGIARVSVTAAQTETSPAVTREVRITVVPNKPKLSSVKASGGKKVKVKWKKVSGVSQYDVSYSCGGKTKTVKVKGSSVTLKGLKKKKNCVVKVRCRVKNSAGTVTSSWSGKKKVKVK